MLKTDIDFEMLAQKREGEMILDIDEVLMSADDLPKNRGQIVLPVLNGDAPWTTDALRDAIIADKFEDDAPVSFRATAIFYVDAEGNRTPLDYGSRVQVEDTFDRDLSDVLRALQEDEE